MTVIDATQNNDIDKHNALYQPKENINTTVFSSIQTEGKTHLSTYWIRNTWFRHTYIQKTQQQYKTVTVKSGDKY